MSEKSFQHSRLCCEVYQDAETKPTQAFTAVREKYKLWQDYQMFNFCLKNDIIIYIRILIQRDPY